MFLCWNQVSALRLPRQLTAVLLLLSIVVETLPLPLPSVSVAFDKDRSQPFPCQNRPCACRSAAQCRRKCCCFTPAQKFVWESQHELQDFKPTDAVPPAEKRTSKPRVNCCSKKRPAESHSVAKSAKSPAKRPQVVIGIVAKKCGGVEQTPFGQAIYVLPPPITLNRLFLATGERIRPVTSSNSRAYREPPVPPPRIVAG